MLLNQISCSLSTTLIEIVISKENFEDYLLGEKKEHLI